MSTVRPLVVAAILLGVAPAQEPKPANAPPTKEQIARWVEQLGHDDFAVREQASAQLAQAIDQAEAALWKVAQSSDAEVARRARDLLKPRWPRTLGNHRGPVRAVTVSADGQRIASGTNDTIKVWDAAQGDLVSSKGTLGPFWDMKFSPDGKHLLFGNEEGSAIIWDTGKGSRLHAIHSNDQNAVAMAISADGKHVASAGTGAGTGAVEVVKIWDASRSNSTITLRGQGQQAAMTFSPDCKRLAGCTADLVKVWDADRGIEVFACKHGGCCALSYRPDGKRLVSAGRSITVWDADRGTQVRTWEDSVPVTAILYSPDGKRLVSGHSDGTINVWDADQGVELLRRKDHTGAILALAISADGRRLVSGSADGTVKIWTIPER